MAGGLEKIRHKIGRTKAGTQRYRDYFPKGTKPGGRKPEPVDKLLADCQKLVREIWE